MAKSSYLITTSANNWSIKEAFRIIEENTPSSAARDNLRTLKDQLKQVIRTKDKAKVKKAQDLIAHWKETKKQLIPKRDKNSTTIGNIENVGILISQPENVTITQNSREPRSPKRRTSQRRTKKRPLEQDDNSSNSGSRTWQSLSNEKKKRKYMNVYLYSYYGPTDFGENEGTHWKVDHHDITHLLRSYRQVSIEGAQKRKHLSDGRTLSLSYIFLLSPFDQCALSSLAPSDKKKVMNQAKSNVPSIKVEADVITKCREMHLLVSDSTMNQDDVSDGISRIKINTSSKDLRMISSVVSDLLPRLLNNNQSYYRQQGEATHIINLVRPYIEHFLIFKLEAIKSEWLTYHFENDNGPTLLPDVVLYIEPTSSITYELFFMEVKRKGNFANNSLERDTVKIGKEMALALNKLVKKKVKDPAVCGLIVEDYLCVLYKMDLLFDGQYRMIELNRFHIARANIDDIMLLPVILEKFNQVAEIMQNTLTNIYQRINDDREDVEEDKSSFMRTVCKNPVAVEKDMISSN